MSRCFGAGKDDEAEVYAGTGVALSLAGGIVLMLVPLLFLDPLTRLLGAGASPALFDYTKTYLRIMLFAVPFAVFERDVLHARSRSFSAITAASSRIITACSGSYRSP